MPEDPLFLPESFDREAALDLYDAVKQRVFSGEKVVALDLAAVERSDSFGAAALLECHRLAKAHGARIRLLNVPDGVRRSLAFLRVDRVALAEAPRPRRESIVARIGAWALDAFDQAVGMLALNLDGLVFVFTAPFRGKSSRSAHFSRQLNAIGAGSVGIIVMISFLIGLIMALQSASQLRQFGANLFAADLVGIVMTRELGPLITAVIIAARSGSSIAAEIGTMVVTEEVDALEVLAIDPKRFLMAPRYVAMAVALPCLTTVADLAGIAGGFVVGTLGLQIGFMNYWNETIHAIFVKDVGTGLMKSFIFANVIATVSCFMGLKLTGGPEEVGRATTRAVVLSIVLVIVMDFLFTTFFYVLD